MSPYVPFVPQNTSFKPNCNWRMSVRVELILPNVALVMPVDGSPQFGWLRKLNASKRNSTYGCRAKWNSFEREKSQFSIPGPMTSLRPAVPNVPFGAREY